jgi:hypothetical protein
LSEASTKVIDELATWVEAKAAPATLARAH